MGFTDELSFTRYLSAKQTVDDRALNARVWARLLDALPVPDRPLQIIELGCGTGTMIERAWAWGLLRGESRYHAVDAAAENIAAAQQQLAQWARAGGLTCEVSAPYAQIADGDRRLHVTLETADVFDFARTYAGPRCDVLIAHAFLDLLHLPTALPRLLSLLRPGGLAYFTLNFDGVTALEPAVEPALDAQIESVYHRTMDERQVAGRPSGDSRTGRHLLTQLPEVGCDVLAAGSSDWVVIPQDGRYPADEAYFLHFIVQTMREALRGQPPLAEEDLDGWAERRHHQIDQGRLVYIAHQIDVLGRAGTGQG